MQTCYNCGRQVDDNVLICPDCGALVRRYGKPAPQQEEPVADLTYAPETAEARPAKPKRFHCIAAESKRAGDMVNSRKLFDDSETAHPIEPEEYIPVENIRGKLLLIGAEDDALWDTAKYICRMEKRLAEKPHECEIETMVYAHGTHFVFPEGMLKIMLPIGSGLFVKFAFQAAKKYPKECRQTRIDIEKRIP